MSNTQQALNLIIGASRSSQFKTETRGAQDDIGRLREEMRKLKQQQNLLKDFQYKTEQAKKAEANLLAARKEMERLRQEAARNSGDKINKDMGKAQQSLERLERAYTEARKAQAASNRTAREAGVNTRNTANETERLTQRQQQLRRAHQNSMEAASRQRGAMSGLRSEILQLGGAYLGLQGIISAGKSTIQAGQIAEGLDSAFNAIFKSQEKATAEMAFVSSTANELGLDLTVLANSYKLWAASAENSSLAGFKQKEIFLAVSRASRTLNLSADDTEGSLKALSQMLSKGKVSAEELNGQLGERMPGALQMASDAMGMTKAELLKLMADGQLMAEDLLPRLAVEINKTFGGEALAKAQETYTANLNRAKNEVQNFQAAMFQAASPALSDMMKTGADAAKYLTTNIGMVKNGATAAGIAIGVGLGGSLLLAQTRLMMTSLAAMKATGTLTTMTIASRGLSASMALLGGPIGLLALAAGGAYYFYQENERARNSVELADGSLVSYNYILQQATGLEHQYTFANAKKRAEIRAGISDLLLSAEAHREEAGAVLEAAKAKLQSVKKEGPGFFEKLMMGDGGGQNHRNNVNFATVDVENAIANLRRAGNTVDKLRDKFKGLDNKPTGTPEPPPLPAPPSSGGKNGKGGKKTPKPQKTEPQKAFEAYEYERLLMEQGEHAAGLYKLSIDGVTGAQAENVLQLKEKTKALQEQQQKEQEAEQLRKQGLETLNQNRFALAAEEIERVKGKEAADIYRLSLKGLGEEQAKELLQNERLTAQMQEKNKVKKEAEKNLVDLNKQLKSERIYLTQGANAARLFELRTAGYSDKLAKATIAAENNISALEKWGDINSTVSDGLADGIISAVETGKFEFSSLKDSVKDMFNNMVLRPVINAIMSPIAGGITNMLMGGSNAAQNLIGGSGSGGGFSLSNLSSLSNLTGIGGYASNLGASLLGGAGTQQAAMLAAQTGSFGTQGAMATYGALNTGTSGAAAFGGGMGAAALGGLAAFGLSQKYGIGAGFAGGAASTAIAGGVSAALGGGSFMAGAGATLAAIPGIGWAALGLGAIAGSLFKDDDSPRAHLVGDKKLEENDGMYLAANASELYGQTFQETGKLTQDYSSRNPFGNLYAAAHGTHDIGAQADKRLIQSLALDERMGHLLHGLADESEVERIKADFENVDHNGVDGLAGVFTDRIKTMGKALPDVIENLIDFEGETEEITAAIEQISAVSATSVPLVQGLGWALGDTNDEIIANTVALAQLAGGAKALNDANAFYFKEFYTDTEKSQRVYGQQAGVVLGFNQRIGLEGDASIDTHAEYRAYVEGLDKTTDEGRRLFAEAQSVIAAVDFVADSDKSVHEIIGRLPEDVKDMALDVAADTKAQNELVIKTLSEDVDDLGSAAQNASDTIQQAASDIETAMESVANNAKDMKDKVLAGLRENYGDIEDDLLIDVFGVDTL